MNKKLLLIIILILSIISIITFIIIKNNNNNVEESTNIDLSIIESKELFKVEDNINGSNYEVDVDIENIKDKESLINIFKPLVKDYLNENEFNSEYSTYYTNDNNYYEITEVIGYGKVLTCQLYKDENLIVISTFNPDDEFKE